MVGKYIREQLGDLNQFLDDDELPENLPPADLEVVGNVVVGSKLPAISFSALEAEMKNDAAFTKFRIRFAEFLNVFLPAYGYPLPHGKRVALVAGEEVSFFLLHLLLTIQHLPPDNPLSVFESLL
jgi:hypothetical protein